MRKSFSGIIARLFWMLSVLIVNLIPANVMAFETEALPERELSQDVLDLNGFYLASDNVLIKEDAGHGYLLRLGRGGSCEGEASVTVRMADFTSRYGTDYTVALLNGAKAETDEDMYSFADLMSGEYDYGELKDSEELAEEYENNEETQRKKWQSTIDQYILSQEEDKSKRIKL